MQNTVDFAMSPLLWSKEQRKTAKNVVFVFASYAASTRCPYQRQILNCTECAINVSQLELTSPF